jgi:hypothetical protein
MLVSPCGRQAEAPTPLLLPGARSDALSLLVVPGLLICVDGSASDDDARACREQFEILTQRQWTHLPAFVDQVDEVPVASANDLLALRTVGVVLALPDA